MSKSIAFNAVPPKSATADSFVQAYTAPENPLAVVVQSEKMARVTVEIPTSSHRRFKAQAAGDGHKIADLVREWVEGYLTKAQM